MREPQTGKMDHSASRVRPGRSDNLIAGAVIAVVVGLWGLPWLGLGPARVAQALVSHKSLASTVVPPARQPDARSRAPVASEGTHLRATRDGNKEGSADTKEQAALSSAKRWIPGAVANSSRPLSSTAEAKERAPSRATPSAASRPDEALKGGDERQAIGPARQQPTATRAPGTSYVTPDGRTVIVAPPP